ncbi:MAG: valine--tRNA ligase [Planctomycetes bacterium]|nr:valine--tRNA ligase [Planctomycetota bacterium]
MPGTDHAGIATQAVVETRLKELEGKTRHDIGREALVERIWQWKEDYEQRIVRQQQEMGCSCDWQRARFTMDPVCRAAVLKWFERMFSDELIYRGNRLVNWDCYLQTAVSDDEVVHEAVAGHFWHLRYPIIEPKEGEPEFVVVATTRPETMLGDTAVACHPQPRNALEQQLQAQRDKGGDADAIERRIANDLPRLELLTRMANDGRKVRLPLLNREIPLIVDEWAKPALGSGCVKITPAHDPNDYEVWQRNPDIGAINILEPDGKLNGNAGPYAGDDRFAARKRVVADLEAAGLMDAIEDHEVEIGHSDRSKTPIEPYLSKQWFVRMGDIDGGVVMGRDTPHEFRTPGLAQAAIDAIDESWSSATGRRLKFWPDPVRYGNTYKSWLAEKRDWCISRQLWWGHRIPIWRRTLPNEPHADLVEEVDRLMDLGARTVQTHAAELDQTEVQVCLGTEAEQREFGPRLEELGYEQDPDVLDTWFSSALWPHSTLGWPDPAAAQVNDGQRPLAGTPSSLDYYYPGSCLVTGRDIITLWVARMVIAGLYNLGDLPFTDSFIHATILDGRGVRMSKSKGNGADPVDIIERYGADAMRFVLCEMQTGLQDIRLPVQAISPFGEDGEKERLIDLAKAKAGRFKGIYIDPVSGKEFDCTGNYKDLPQAKVISDRFEIGRNFCNKLWNAARFALMNLGELEFRALTDDDLAIEDRWILSRLHCATRVVTAHLESYDPASAIQAARDFLWNELCDWYLELIKPRLQDATAAPVARQVLAFALDQALRLLHPFVPFITESLWEHLRAHAPVRGIHEAAADAELIIAAPFPVATAEPDAQLEARFELAFEVIRGVRDLRHKYGVPPGKNVDAALSGGSESLDRLAGLGHHVQRMAGLATLANADSERPALSATVVVGDLEIHISGVLDPVKEKERLLKQRGKLAGQLEGTRKKLDNEGFVARAPAEVVDRERARIGQLEDEVTLIDENLERLESPAK